jgi:3-oxoacyl-[acyl-carrier protein] reductase
MAVTALTRRLAASADTGYIPARMARLTKLSRSIEGRVAVITGAASGMGRATAHLFADEGARVAAVDRNVEGVQAVADEINGAGGAAVAYGVDLANRDEINMLVARVIAELGPVDILVNNAGISIPAPIDAEHWERAWDLTLAVNLTAYARMIRACASELGRDGEGRVVNIASTEGLGATAGGSPYTAAKHGVIGLTRSFAVELGPRGVNVNAVCPGPIRTNMTAAIPEEHKTIFAKRRVALKRYGEPEEVAHATLSLCLPAASFITGAVLVVDGGMTIRNA